MLCPELELFLFTHVGSYFPLTAMLALSVISGFQ